jgi:hypothetical protein
MHKYIFTDTNLFEQFQPITDIDWLSLAKCTSATLIIPAVTLKELNEHKDGASRGRLKRKAASALSALRRYSVEPAPVYVRPSVEIEFRPAEPNINFAEYHLSEGVEDDRLLAAGIQFSIENALDGLSVLITTGDFGLELKAKSQTLVAPLALPEAYRLPPEPDDEEKQIAEMKRRLLQLERAAPGLTLSFQNDAKFAKISVSSSGSVEDFGIKEVMLQERSDRPFLQDHAPTGIVGWQFSLSTREDIEEYNSSLQTYFKKLEEWLALELAWKKWHSLTGKLQFQLNNNGGAPGTGIHADLHFPDGCGVLSEADLPRLPERPKPPLSSKQRILAAVDLFRTPVFDFTLPQLTTPKPHNTRLSSIKKTNSYLVRFEVQQLKHTLTEPLPPVFVHFPTTEEASGFRIEYRIVAANYPEPFEGTLDVEVVKG